MNKRLAILIALAAAAFAEDRPPEPNNTDGTVVSIRWYRYALTLEQRLYEIATEREAASENERAQMLALLLKLEPVAEKAARSIAKAPPYTVIWSFSAAPAGVTATVIQRRDMDGGDAVTLAEIPPESTSYTDVDRPLGRFLYTRRHKLANGTLSAPVSQMPTVVLHAPAPP